MQMPDELRGRLQKAIAEVNTCFGMLADLGLQVEIDTFTRSMVQDSVIRYALVVTVKEIKEEKF